MGQAHTCRVIEASEKLSRTQKKEGFIETKVGIHVLGHLQSFQKWHRKCLEGVQSTMSAIPAALKKQDSPACA